MNTYVYHQVPENMSGKILYPLNSLKDSMPDHYEKELRKYKGREHLTEEAVPNLNCLWNEVVNFSCVSPKEIFSELKQLGITYPASQFYQIDISTLDPSKLIYHSNLDGYQYSKKLSDFSYPITLPDKTKSYFRKCLQKQQKPNIFVHLTHLLYQGEVNIKNWPIINIKPNPC